MKKELKQFLCNVNDVNIMLKKHSLMLEALQEEWQGLFDKSIYTEQPIAKLSNDKKAELVSKINDILSQVPTCYNNNANVLYKDIKKDYAKFLDQVEVKESDSKTVLEQLIQKQQMLEIEYDNYNKHKTTFQKTLKSITAMKSILSLKEKSNEL